LIHAEIVLLSASGVAASYDEGGLILGFTGDGLAEVLVVAGGTLHCLAARQPALEEPKR
jgi:hypothetical protein